MILTKLILTDYGIYRGRHEITLTPKPRRPILLFGGNNGAGKSTLLEAIQICLYGAGAFQDALSKEAYLSHLERRIHTNPTLLIQPTFASLGLEFQYGEPEGTRTYTITRSWERRPNSKVSEHLDVTRDGNPLDELAAEQWQDFVKELIPPGVAQFFFFDGEKIQQLAEERSDQQTLAGAIKSLLGLDIMERLQSDLGVYMTRLAKTSKGTDQVRQLDEVQLQETQIQQSLAEKKAQRQDQERSLQELRDTIASVEAKLAGEGGGFARRRDQLHDQKARLQAVITEREQDVRYLCAGLLPFALAPDLLRKLRQQLLSEEEAQVAQAGRTFLQQTKEELLHRVKDEDFWAAFSEISTPVQDKLRKQLIERLQAPLAVEQPISHIELVHGLSTVERQHLLPLIGNALDDLPPKSRALVGEVEQLSRELHRVEETLQKTPADDVIKPLLEELQVLHQRLATANQQALQLDEAMKADKAQLAELERRHQQLARQQDNQTAEHSRLQLVPRIQTALDEYQQALLEKKVNALQTEVSECFARLCRKKDALRHIRIKPKDFSVTLFDQRNHPLPKSQLSAGEKQIYAISMLWALAKTSGRPLPMIVDTPLARLDSEHRKLLITHYFPVVSHQVIILSTDTEVDQTYFAALLPAVARAYRLEYQPQKMTTQIFPGYFQPETLRQ